MHVVIFTDQNPASLGGNQASVSLQKRFLEFAGHRVSVVTAKGDHAPAPGVITYPSLPLTLNREFAFTLRIKRAVKVTEERLSKLGVPVDVVHIQADNWGAAIGNLFAAKHNLPVVYTLHTNLDYALKKIVGDLGAKTTALALSAGNKFLGGLKGSKITTDSWEYLAIITRNADLVLAPSQHFANLAMKHNVSKNISVLPNGVDDKFATTDLKIAPKATHKSGDPVTLIWCGRISPEKRIMVFLEAVKLAKVNALVKIYGTGSQLEDAEKFVDANRLGKTVKFMGRLSHNDMLLEMSAADIMVQTSVGFETQGMTVYEAGVMGTPSIICDHNIAGDIPEGSYWLVDDESAQSLAKTLKKACADVENNRSKVIDLREKMLQSRITELQVSYYKQAIRAHRAKQN